MKFTKMQTLLLEIEKHSIMRAHASLILDVNVEILCALSRIDELEKLLEQSLPYVEAAMGKAYRNPDARGLPELIKDSLGK